MLLKMEKIYSKLSFCKNRPKTARPGPKAAARPLSHAQRTRVPGRNLGLGRRSGRPRRVPLPHLGREPARVTGAVHLIGRLPAHLAGSKPVAARPAPPGNPNSHLPLPFLSLSLSLSLSLAQPVTPKTSGGRHCGRRG
jgi:hypothetical protein